MQLLPTQIHTSSVYINIQTCSQFLVYNGVSMPDTAVAGVLQKALLQAPHPIIRSNPRYLTEELIFLHMTVGLELSTNYDQR